MQARHTCQMDLIINTECNYTDNVAGQVINANRTVGSAGLHVLKVTVLYHEFHV